MEIKNYQFLIDLWCQIDIVPVNQLPSGTDFTISLYLVGLTEERLCNDMAPLIS